MLRVQGDSMQPTINDGDWVWVDISNNFISSDGMYLIRMATGLAVKRLQSGLSNIVIKSDNPTYYDITADIGEINIIGKVVYILNGRRV
jgi:phage repressor protein C with HTH and peptisase S24 domain